MKTTGILEAGNSFHNMHGMMEIFPTTSAREVRAFLRNNSCMMQDCCCSRDYARIDDGSTIESFYSAAMDNGELGINGIQEARSYTA